MGNPFLQQLVQGFLSNPQMMRDQMGQMGDPNQAYGRVQNMLNSGQMNQDQLNAILPAAQQLYTAMFGNKR